MRSRPGRYLLSSMVFLSVIALGGEPRPAAPALNIAQKPIRLPEGPSQAGWSLLLKNQFEEAEATFRKVLAQDAKDLAALEGLRSVRAALGDYKQVQQLNLQLTAAAGDHGLAILFANRTLDASSHVESRAAIGETFTKLIPTAHPALASALKDNLATLQLRANKPAEAKALLAGLGYVDLWHIVTGPFGSRERGEAIDKRFAPERSFKSLAFSDEKGKPVPLKTNIDVPHRGVDFSQVLQSGSGVFYALTSLQSEQEQEVIIGLSAPQPYRVYLRGLPIGQEPGEEQFPRGGGDLLRTRLLKGHNPLLLKIGSYGSVSVRIMSLEYGPAEGVRSAPLPEAELAQLETLALRGVLFSQKVPGCSAERMLRRLPATARPSETSSVLSLLAEDPALNFPEALWLDLVLQRENDLRARLALGRRLAGSAPECVHLLDAAAYIIQAAGASMGDSDARQAEEARRIREHALSLVPKAHQHLLGLYYFFSERNLPDQAFAHIRSCAGACPDSALAQYELARAYQNKGFMVEAEQGHEKAAALDVVYLPALASFHETFGNRVRGRELRLKQSELEMLDPRGQFEAAFAQGDLLKAESLLAQQEKLYPDRAQEFTATRIRLLIAKGDFKDALKQQEKAYLELSPRHHNKRSSLLSLVELALRLNKDQRARELLREYLTEWPGDYELRQRLSGLESEQTTRWWETYDVKVNEIDTSAFTAEKYRNANHAWIVDFMVTRVLPDLSRESYVHIAQKVLNVKGINELSEVLVAAQRNQIVFIRTLNPDGSTYEPQNVHDFNLEQSASLYKVGPGSILEHAYLEHAEPSKDDPALHMGFNFYAIDAPRAVSRWVVLIADEAKSKLDIRKVRPELIEEKILSGPPGYTVYQWTNTQVEGIKYEPNMAGEGENETIPIIQIETPDRPLPAAHWRPRREREFLPAQAIDEARRLAAMAGDGDAAKFKAIVNYVRDKIQPSQDARTLDDVWYMKSGSALQMTVLAREMAQAVGLKVYAAHVNAAYQPGREWQRKNAKYKWAPEQLVSFGSGGQMLVLEHEAGPDLWMQYVGNSPKYFDPFDQARALGGCLALLGGDAGARIKRVRGEEQGLLSATQHLEAALDEKGHATVKGRIQVYGGFAGNVRESLADPRQKPRIKEWIARSAWPKIQQPQVQIENEEDPEKPVRFSYTGLLAPLAQPEKGRFLLEPFVTPARLLNFRGVPERQHDFLIRNEVADLDHTLTYTLPEGFGWVEVPDDLFISTEHGFYIADYNVTGRTLSCTRSYVMPMQRIVPEKYPAVLEFLNSIAAEQQQRISYAPLNSQDFGGRTREVFSPGYARWGEKK